MKNFCKFLVIAILLSNISQLYSQQLYTPNYFPHAVGNVWQYMYNDGRFYQEKIYEDLIDNFGNTFLGFGSSLPEYRWIYRINAAKDSVFRYPFTSNRLVYKFPLDSGEIFQQDTTGIFYGKVYDTYDVIIFGDTTHAIEIRYYGQHPDTFPTMFHYHEVLAENYGKIYYGDEVEYMVLIGFVIDGDTTGFIFTDVEDNKPSTLPSDIELYQNYPNPFNPTTTINYQIPKAGRVVLRVYDILGKEVATLVNEEKEVGRYSVNFDTSSAAGGLSSGVYLYELVANDYKNVKKMMILK